MIFGRGGWQKTRNKARAEPFGGGIPDCERDEAFLSSENESPNHRKPAQPKLCLASAATNSLAGLLGALAHS
jgi:hypothetical protein